MYPLERKAKERELWLEQINKLDAKKLVFLDECSSYLYAQKPYGWAKRSERLIAKEPKGKKERVSLIAAIGLNKSLAQHALVHPDSVDKSAFKAFLKDILLPKLEAKTILIMDNWTVHHGQDIKDLVESFNCGILYLPTYSPDFNPIEFLFSKIKAFIKKLSSDSVDDLVQAFIDACKNVPLNEISNAFRHCGYLVQ